MIMLDRSMMHNYQLRAIEFIKNTKRCGLFLFMGAGKTTSTLTAISDLSDGLLINKVLIIAPLRVANTVWKQEAIKWKHLQHLKINICTGSERERLAGFQTNADIYVINRENVDWLVNLYKTKWPFDCVIIDESSSFKDSGSRRFKALKKVSPFTNYMVLLTGTPSPNGLLDLWSQMYLIDFGQALGRTKTAYTQRFFESDYMGYKLTPIKGADTKIHSLIAPKILSMSAEDYLEVPEKIELVSKVVFDKKTLLAYRTFEKNLFAQLPDGEQIEAISAAVLANKLLQWCCGAVYLDESKNYSVIHDLKLDALEEIVDNNPDENILVAYNFKSDLDRLQKRFKTARVLDKDPQTIIDWNSGKIKMLLAHPASAGHGLNIQHGGSMIVWFGLNWSLELDQQFNARLHRQGQTKPVRIIRIIAEGCLDERVMDVLASKDKTQEKLIKALKC
jgi:SNF2 family DNA or RNA helicase